MAWNYICFSPLTSGHVNVSPSYFLNELDNKNETWKHDLVGLKVKQKNQKSEKKERISVLTSYTRDVEFYALLPYSSVIRIFVTMLDGLGTDGPASLEHHMLSRTCSSVMAGWSLCPLHVISTCISKQKRIFMVFTSYFVSCIIYSTTKMIILITFIFQ